MDGKERRMPRDGRYIVKSQGWRCEYAQGWSVCRGAMDGKERRIPKAGRYSAESHEGDAVL